MCYANRRGGEIVSASERATVDRLGTRLFAEGTGNDKRNGSILLRIFRSSQYENQSNLDNLNLKLDSLFKWNAI